MDIYKYLTRIIVLLFLFSGNHVNGQQFSIYHSITTSNGLPSNYVLSVCEDEEGFLWAGTDKGLCRYNGFTWQVWDKDNGLPGNYINKISADKRGGLFIDISEKGLFHFDIATGKTFKIPKGFNIDIYGNLFFEVPSANKGLYDVYIVKNGTSFFPQKIFSYKAYSYYQFNYDVSANKVIAVSLSGKRSLKDEIFYKGNPELIIRELPSSDNNNSSPFVKDSLIITNSNYYKFGKDGKILSKINIYPKNNTYAHTTVTKKGYYITNVKSGYYFISHNGEKYFSDSRSGLGSDYVNQVYELKDGTIAFATLGAGLQLIKNHYRKTYSTENRLVRSILKSGNGWYILAGEKIFFNREADSSLSVIGSVEPSAFSIYKSNSTLLIGSLKGINFYTLNPKLTPIHFVPFNAGVSSLLETSNGYVGSTYGSSIIKFNANDTRISNIKNPFNIIEKMVPLSKGYASLSYEEGVVFTDTTNKRKIHLTQKDGLLSNSIHSVYEHKDTQWISSKRGINIYTKGKVVKTITFGQQVSEKALLCFHDKANQLWVVSDKSLFMFVGNGLKSITSHPLLSESNDIINAAAYDSSSNTLAIGTLKNFSIIKLDNIKVNNLINTPKISSVKIDTELIHSAINFTVPYQFNTISFNVVPFAASPLSHGRYYYKLENSDEAWKEVKDSLMIVYKTLRPGNYTLKGKIINEDGYESKVVVLSSFKVKKPYWQQGWFYLILFFITILITTLAVRKIDALKKKKKEEKLLLQQSLQNERERISKDLHDHLGSNLVTIVAQVDNIESKLKWNKISEAGDTLQRLSHQARDVITVLRETIWAVQENEHTVESFIIRIRTFLQRFYDSTNITWNLKSDHQRNIVLSPKQTLHLFRVIQEASQNIIKHSHATKVEYRLRTDYNLINLIIHDDGDGIDVNSVTNSNGISNMKSRIIELEGTITLENKKGTLINIDIPHKVKS